MSNLTNNISKEPIYILSNNSKKYNYLKKSLNSLNEPTNQFKKEQKIVQEIYDKLRNINGKLENKKYILLSDIIASLPSAEDINDLLKNFFDELKKHEYTNSELMAISTLLYRLSNIRFVNVELPEQLPNHSENAISNIRNQNDYIHIDKRIKEIVKNLISHYKLNIKNNRNYNRTTENQLALKLKKILFSFIIDFTRPSSEPLSFKTNFQKRENQVAHISTLKPNQLPRKLKKNELLKFFPNL
jgi:hypothetical protein